MIGFNPDDAPRQVEHVFHPLIRREKAHESPELATGSADHLMTCAGIGASRSATVRQYS